MEVSDKYKQFNLLFLVEISLILHTCMMRLEPDSTEIFIA